MFNEFNRAQDERMAESARLQRQGKGIDEAAWQVDHAIWMVWVFRYEILSNNLKCGHFSIAHDYDERCNNVARN